MTLGYKIIGFGWGGIRCNPCSRNKIGYLKNLVVGESKEKDIFFFAKVKRRMCVLVLVFLRFSSFNFVLYQIKNTEVFNAKVYAETCDLYGKKKPCDLGSKDGVGAIR